jgi:hypothetical protein
VASGSFPIGQRLHIDSVEFLYIIDYNSKNILFLLLSNKTKHISWQKEDRSERRLQEGDNK